MPELVGKFRDTGLVEVKSTGAFRRRRLLLDRTPDDYRTEVELVDR